MAATARTGSLLRPTARRALAQSCCLVSGQPLGDFSTDLAVVSSAEIRHTGSANWPVLSFQPGFKFGLTASHAGAGPLASTATRSWVEDWKSSKITTARTHTPFEEPRIACIAVSIARMNSFGLGHLASASITTRLDGCVMRDHFYASFSAIDSTYATLPEAREYG